MRRLLEALASEPLVCVCDDLQWADDVILDLLEHVAARGDDAPILLCCVGRPELLDTKPHWPGVLELQALTAGESDQLLVGLVGDHVLSTAARSGSRGRRRRSMPLSSSDRRRCR